MKPSPKIILSLLFVLYYVIIIFINLTDYFEIIPNQLHEHHGKMLHGHHRVFQGKIIFNNIINYTRHRPHNEREEVNYCENWVVIVVTRKHDAVINDIRSLTEEKGTKWCCVAVLDTDENSEIDFSTISSEKFVVLERKEIKELVLNPGYSSVQNITSHSLTNNKNIGYIYAIRHGAKFIFDAHENYRLTEKEIPYTSSLEEFLLVRSSNSVFNPYMYYYSDQGQLLRQGGLPVGYEWNLNNFSFDVYCKVDGWKIGVMQFMTKYENTPEINVKQKFNKLPLVMERGTQMLYDSHATLHHYSSFFGLHLPFSANKNLQDAMRAFYAQRLMWDIGRNIAVAKPLMEYLKDVESTLISDEEPRVSIPDYLITFLHEWQSESNSLKERMEELAIEFYEKGFWEEEEVYSIQKWIKDLEIAGYNFPKITPTSNEDFLAQKEGCQLTDVPTPPLSPPTDEKSKNNSDIVNRGKLELILRMSANSALVDIYYSIFDWSLRFFWHTEVSPVNLIMILDDEKEKDHVFGKEREKVYPYPTVNFEKPNSYYGTSGHSRMQWSMFWADQYATGEYVGFLDTDTLFNTLIYEDLLFEGNKPIVWGFFGGAGDEWWGYVKLSTYQFLNKKQVVKAMNYFPVIIKVNHLTAMRDYIEKVHGKPFNDVFRSIVYSRRYSQFNIMFTYLWYFHRSEYVWHMEENMGKNYDGPDEITDFHNVTDEMRLPSPKLSIHYRYIEGIRIKVEPEFNPKIFNKQKLKTRNSLMLEGYCYSYGFNNTPKLCTNFDVNVVQESLYEFEDHTWRWDGGALQFNKNIILR